MPEIKVSYLGHSGVAVEIEDTLLIFDYYIDVCEGETRSLSTGVIEPSEIQDKKVIVFSSHKHPDHFNPVILSWKEKIPDIRYFLSSDIPKKVLREWTHTLKPNQKYEEGNLRIRTFKSTDEGVAFLVNIKGISIYHAGDLNWWHWDEEPKAWNNNMAARFKEKVSLIREFPIDIAFLTADPRQEASELWGISYFLEQANVKIAFPMHFGEDYSIMERIKNKANENPDFLKVQIISKRGQCFQFDL